MATRTATRTGGDADLDGDEGAGVDATLGDVIDGEGL
jgi:hypothetical protein